MISWTIILYFIVTYSISFMFVYATGPFRIFERMRENAEKFSPLIGELFSCMYCFPTWVGIGLSLLNQFVFPQIGFTPFYILFGSVCPWYIILIFNWFVTSGGVYIIECIIKRLLGEVPENGGV